MILSRFAWIANSWLQRHGYRVVINARKLPGYRTLRKPEAPKRRK